jgi:hypothetical protein
MSNIGLDLGKGLAHLKSKGVLELVLGIGEMEGIA